MCRSVLGYLFLFLNIIVGSKSTVPLKCVPSLINDCKYLFDKPSKLQ